MLAGEFNISLLSYGLACLCYVGLFALYAGRLWRIGDRLTPANWLFCAALLASVVWSAIGLGAHHRPWRWLGDLLLPIADILRYGLWFGFILLLLRPASAERPQRALPLAAIAALLLALGLQLIQEFGPYRISELERPVAFSGLALAVVGLMLVEQLLRSIKGDARWSAKPVCLALGALFIFDLYTYSQAALFRQFDGDAIGIRPAVHAIAAPLLFIASRRHKDWLSKLHVSRAAVFHSATLLIAGAYLLLVSAVGYYVRYTGGNWGRALQMALMVVGLLALVMVLLSGAMRAKLRVYISKNFFSYRYDYREEWLRFTAMLSSQSSPQELGISVIKGLANLVESPAGTLWLRHGVQAEYSQSAHWNMPARNEREPADSPMAQFLRQRHWIVDFDELRRSPQSYPGFECPAWLLEDARCWLLVPLVVGADLIGFVLLSRPRTPLELNWEVRDLLRTASSQASSYLAQMQATEALLEARKFDAFNRMSAFVVHDLKNIVTQLSLMMKNARRLRDNPEFQEDMLATVENSLEKMRQLMLQLREGESPHGLSRGVDLAPIARRLAVAAQSKGRELQLDIQAAASTRGHEERVERVIGHAVQNAFDATPEQGRVWLQLNVEGSYARIEVGDTGCGMSEEFIRTRLFKPFQTTKSSGMGIGAFESFQYLNELGGKINVDSEIDRGTRITILLPLFRASQASDLGMLGAK
ncbi:PEP-CTERM system histidine kinase PrsK [Paucibacter sp. PLA-PC-4]|uniref:XrtA/PEP-CTERM system histidine kinase PrsK n=1 Tax=Paucibacter sp. PLA-PC-4 TaxID=2993655 RepID=UPI00224B1CE8|nr:XrtA/PEP-CTERM system histidine kinase PrsK [Paucibacter sp. PLA-PC-4]MCX2864478.1 PEP-CTERM system histidine kinase PrsK [Paucibacter sp. PLA-PC-4]